MRADASFIPRPRSRSALLAGALALAATSAFSMAALADEAGVSFWVPGSYGSLAAVPLQPGFSVSTVYWHDSISASGSAALQRELEFGRFNGAVTLNANVKVNSTLDLGFVDPTYTFATPILGGQLSIDMLEVIGSNATTLSGMLSAMAGPVIVSHQGSISDSVVGVGDLYPKATLRWNAGVNNYMTYLAGDIPVGAYNSARLANLGIGHGAVDWGGGYTYLNPQTGHEFSAVTGVTFNMVNPSTNYQNGIDWHLDWGASQFLSKTMFLGAAGYFYDQLTADKGSAAFLGPIYSRVIGVGPQVGWIIPLGGTQMVINLKAYKEFDAQDRPDGWNAWVALNFSPAPQAVPPAPNN